MAEQLTLFGEREGSAGVVALDALQVGDVVIHQECPGLRGQIVAVEDGRAALRLLTWPTEFLRRWYNDGRTCPVLVANLILSE